jgi:hypothetical protein
MSKEERDSMKAEISSPPKHPDRLVAFVYLLELGGVDVQSYIDAATEINLAEVPKVPELVEGEDIPDDYEGGLRVHHWAYSLTGSSAKARSALSQLSDGEQPGWVSTGPDQVSDLVTEVADRIARETAVAEVQSTET